MKMLNSFGVIFYMSIMTLLIPVLIYFRFMDFLTDKQFSKHIKEIWNGE